MCKSHVNQKSIFNSNIWKIQALAIAFTCVNSKIWSDISFYIGTKMWLLIMWFHCYFRVRFGWKIVCPVSTICYFTYNMRTVLISFSIFNVIALIQITLSKWYVHIKWLWAELSATRNTQAEEEEASHPAMYLKCMGHVKE